MLCGWQLPRPSLTAGAPAELMLLLPQRLVFLSRKEGGVRKFNWLSSQPVCQLRPRDQVSVWLPAGPWCSPTIHSGPSGLTQFPAALQVPWAPRASVASPVEPRSPWPGSRRSQLPQGSAVSCLALGHPHGRRQLRDQPIL